MKQLNKTEDYFAMEDPLLDYLVDVEKKADDAKKLTAQVSTMTDEQLAALKAAIDAKEKQQQN